MELTFEQAVKLDALQAAYADSLDSKDMAGWLACFAEQDDVTYVCAPKENVDNGLPIAHMLDDNYSRLKDRVKYVTQIWVGIFEDYQTRHLVQALDRKIVSESMAEMRSNFVVLSTAEESGLTSVLVAGTYLDVVDLSGEKAKFISRRAIIDTNVQPRYLVYPV